MKEPDALKLEQQIRQICEKERTVWVETRYERRPELGKIVVIVDIKVDKDN